MRADQLRAGESPAKSVRRIIRREAAKALRRLEAGDPPPDAAVHDARKRLKRARAALRLVRKDLGARRFQRENEALRDAARPLSEIRDAKILVEAFDALAKRAPTSDRPALRHVRELLIAHQVRVRERVFGTKAPLKPVTTALKAARRRTGDWPLDHAGWSLVGPGLRRVYGSGRQVFQTVRQKPLDGNLHELRKQAKYLWHQLEMLAPIAPALIRDLAGRAHQLSDALGDDHDLAVLKQRLTRTRPRIPRTANATLSRMIAERRDELQARALALGARMYDESPRRFAKLLHGRWRYWQG